jgi:hypothetical protein
MPAARYPCESRRRGTLVSPKFFSAVDHTTQFVAFILEEYPTFIASVRPIDWFTRVCTLCFLMTDCP